MKALKNSQSGTVHVATVGMIVAGDANTGPKPTLTPSQREPQRERHGRLVPENPSFNWNAQDRYVNFINFEMEDTNILEMKAYELINKKGPSN